MAAERPLYVVGHRNPDTDSVCSAVVYASFQRDVLGRPARAYRAGNVNPQTAFVLTRAGVSTPPLLTDVYPKIADIMIRGPNLITLSPQASVAQARSLLLKHQFTFLPVCDDNGSCLGKITTLQLLRLPDLIADIDKSAIQLSLDALCELLEVEAPRHDGRRWFSGHVTIVSEDGDADRRAAAREDGEGFLRIFSSVEGFSAWRERQAGDRSTALREADIAIICSTTGRAHRETPEARSGMLLTTAGSVTDALSAIALAAPIRSFVEESDIRFNPADRVRDVHAEIAKSNLGGFLVTKRNGTLAGVITRMSFLNESRFRLALVDHNEYSQAVPGIEHAEVEEIIDHHRIGTRSTDQPITFINRVVGSTATIIAGLYRSHGSEPGATHATLLLAAILSDTVILRSPTTTEEDREAAAWMAELSGLDIERFGREMFEAGSVLATEAPEKLVTLDQKRYRENKIDFLVSQVETVGFSTFWQRAEAIASALEREVAAQSCRFGCLMVSDITAGDTLLLVAGNAEIKHRISYPEKAGGVFELRGVLSRKKQVLPYLVELLRQGE